MSNNTNYSAYFGHSSHQLYNYDWYQMTLTAGPKSAETTVQSKKSA